MGIEVLTPTQLEELARQLQYLWWHVKIQGHRVIWRDLYRDLAERRGEVVDQRVTFRQWERVCQRARREHAWMFSARGMTRDEPPNPFGLEKGEVQIVDQDVIEVTDPVGFAAQLFTLKALEGLRNIDVAEELGVSPIALIRAASRGEVVRELEYLAYGARVLEELGLVHVKQMVIATMRDLVQGGENVTPTVQVQAGRLIMQIMERLDYESPPLRPIDKDDEALLGELEALVLEAKSYGV